MINDIAKWDNYYTAAATPPWESDMPYHGLCSFLAHMEILNERETTTENSPGRVRLNRGDLVCEFGAGCSASAIYLVEHGFSTTAIDLSPLAKKRFLKMYVMRIDMFMFKGLFLYTVVVTFHM